MVEGVAARAGGVPLFVEEVTRLLLERSKTGGVEAIPPTLQQLLAARLDRLGPAREVAQVASVLGRDFSYALLSAVAGVEDAALREALERLVETTSCMCVASRLRRTTASSTRWFATRLTRAC
jgi:predicted ATPase